MIITQVCKKAVPQKVTENLLNEGTNSYTFYKVIEVTVWLT